MKKKSYISTKFIILIPVFILGFVSVVSNILAVTNIKRVNANATQIANGYMSCISELGDIQKETLLIHRLGLSHIVATDLDAVLTPLNAPMVNSAAVSISAPNIPFSCQ